MTISEADLVHLRRAAANLTADERAAATVYTSGEHCPMCSAAHAWVGLGRIVYVASAGQISGWRAAAGAAPSAVSVLPIAVVAPGLPVEGPVGELVPEVRQLIEKEIPKYGEVIEAAGISIN